MKVVPKLGMEIHFPQHLYAADCNLGIQTARHKVSPCSLRSDNGQRYPSQQIGNHVAGPPAAEPGLQVGLNPYHNAA